MNPGSVSDYINTALAGHRLIVLKVILNFNSPIQNFSHSNSSHNHYDTDFPELTSKFESFGLHSGEAPGTQTIPDLF